MKGRCCANYSFDVAAKLTQLNNAKIKVKCNDFERKIMVYFNIGLIFSHVS